MGGLTTLNPDTFGGGWGSFADGLSSTFNTALDLGLKYELIKQARDNSGQGQGDALAAVTKDSQPNVAPTNVNPDGEQESQWLNGVDNKLVIVGGLVVALIAYKAIA